MQNVDTFRYERKYIWPYSRPTELVQKINLHPALFCKSYPNRRVHSLYFDTPNLFFLQQNILGQSTRAKIRLRWYTQGKIITQPHLEIKYKDGEVNIKKLFTIDLKKPISKIVVNKSDMNNVMKKIRSLLKTEIQQAALLEPYLLNYYDRQYYFSAQTGIRVTIDSDLHFGQLTHQGQGVVFQTIDHCILEAKYAVQDDKKLRVVAQHFPLRISKVSKYELGMRLTYPQAV